MNMVSSNDMHRRVVHDTNRENKTKETSTQLVVPVPVLDVHHIEDFWKIYLVEEQKLERMKAEKKVQVEKMEALVEHIKNELLSTEKKRKLFYVPPTEEMNFGVCCGLRLAKHSRTEQLGEKRMGEVTLNATLKLLKDHLPSETLPSLAKAYASEILNARTRNVGYQIERVLPKGHNAGNARKKQKKTEQL